MVSLIHCHFAVLHINEAMDDYQQYEEGCKQVRQVNRGLLDEFASWPKKIAGLSNKTIKSHRANVDFYINEFLLYEDVIAATEGIYRIDMFLGYWFIRKAMWASPASIKSHAVSIKKFYSFLLTKDLIKSDALEKLAEMIKDGLPTWVAKASSQSRY